MEEMKRKGKCGCNLLESEKQAKASLEERTNLYSSNLGGDCMSPDLTQPQHILPLGLEDLWPLSFTAV